MPIVSQNTGREDPANERRYTLTTERWKLIRIEGEDGATRHLLHDLEADPFELTDIGPQHPELLGELASTLEAALAEQRRHGLALRGPNSHPTTPTDPALVEQLRSLGYVDAAAPTPGSTRSQAQP
jgi:hypothetical protein